MSSILTEGGTCDELLVMGKGNSVSSDWVGLPCVLAGRSPVMWADPSICILLGLDEGLEGGNILSMSVTGTAGLGIVKLGDCLGVCTLSYPGL